MNARPTGGSVFVVRWVRADGASYKQRFYRRLCDAEVFVGYLTARGIDSSIYSSPVRWTEVAP
jgi:hypothetical protein